MIVHLTGPPGVGKSRFAKWFMSQYHSAWHYMSVDKARRLALFLLHEKGQDPSPQGMEQQMIAEMNYFLDDKSFKFHLIESTGHIWRFRQLWTPERVRNGIYIIQMFASAEECKDHVKDRVRAQEKLLSANLDQAIDEYMMHPTYANLLVNLSNLDDFSKIFPEIEWYIMKAKAYYDKNS